jgi:hypothetical protein
MESVQPTNITTQAEKSDPQNARKMAKTNVPDGHLLDHPQSQELEAISAIIDANSTIFEHV